MIEFYLALMVLVPGLFLVLIEVVVASLSRSARAKRRGRPVRFRIVDAINRRSMRQKSIKGEIRQRSYILVIGGCSYVGQQLVKQLLRQPDTNIRVFDRRVLPPADRLPEVTYFAGDICNVDHITASLHGISVVYHVGAARSLVGLSQSFLWETNVLATESILEQCLKNNVERLLFVSSAMVGAPITALRQGSKVTFAAHDFRYRSQRKTALCVM